MYTDINFKTGKALRDAIKDGREVVRVFSHGPYPCPTEGEVSVEGPHYPEPHRWYARVKLLGGRVVKVL